MSDIMTLLLRYYGVDLESLLGTDIATYPRCSDRSMEAFRGACYETKISIISNMLYCFIFICIRRMVISPSFCARHGRAVLFVFMCACVYFSSAESKVPEQLIGMEVSVVRRRGSSIHTFKRLLL